MVVFYLAEAAASFIAGALPTSYLAGRVLRGIDLRRHGSGNLGATNVLRVMGALPALLVLSVDILKGFAPVFWLPSLMGGSGVMILQCALGLCAIAGHVFSPFIGFKGGKGVATGAGVMLAISPAATGVCVLVWVLSFAALRIVAVASLAAALTLPLAIYMIMDRTAAGFEILQAFGLFVAGVVFFTHRANIGRLVRGEEKRISRGGGSR